MRATLGLGAGACRLYLPRRSGRHDFDSGLFAAIGAGLAIAGIVSSQWLLSAEA